jgi:hypothetical protein
MKDWKDSSFLLEMNEIHQKDAWMFLDITKTAKLLVTLSLLDINKASTNGHLFDIRELGPTFWTYASNYYMGRM